MTGEAVDIDRALPEMRAVASRLTPTSWQHPGQITWSARYALPEDLDHGPVWVFRDGALPVGWAWVESPDWMEWCVDPDHAGVAERAVSWFLETTTSTVRAMTLDTEPHLVAALAAAGFLEEPGPWFSQHTMDLANLAPVPDVPGYALRAVRPGEHDARAACHRRSWADTSKVSGAAYRRLMATRPYRAALDWVAVTTDDEMVASCCVWLDDASGVALVEPVGLSPRAPSPGAGERRQPGSAPGRSGPGWHHRSGAPTRRQRLSRAGTALPRHRLRARPADPHVGAE